MKPLNWIERIIHWITERSYNCEKGKHQWGYTLSETGSVYLDQTKIPDSAWHCLKCGERRYKDLTIKP